jgi:hypothetical protein
VSDFEAAAAELVAAWVVITALCLVASVAAVVLVATMVVARRVRRTVMQHSEWEDGCRPCAAWVAAG